MTRALSRSGMTAEQDERISAAIEREGPRLRNFIRKRIANQDDVDDVLQDVFSELVEAYRLTEPIEQVGAWLFRVARNRIIDLFRRRAPVALADASTSAADDGEVLTVEDLLPSPDAGPEALYARNVLLEAVHDALEELPEEQREVFIAHEFEGRSFKDLAAETGVSVNTLLSRKHYAVLHLRRRLRVVHEEFAQLMRTRT
jgi:RNA polymerase sigma factor (sigma-70 family)